MTSCVRSLGRAGTLASLCVAAALSACGGDSSTDPGGASPGVPSALTAVANTTTQVTLNWVLPAGTVSEVKVQRSVAGAAYAPLITLKPAANSYVDTGLSANTAYKYQIQACNGSSCSAFTEVSVTTTPGGAAALAIWNPALPPSMVGYTYNPILRTTGGSGTTRTWSQVSGALPSGLRLNADGTFGGTPTVTGSFPITVRVTGGGETIQKDFTIRIFQADLTRFNITRMDLEPVAANLEPAVQAAIARWESIIVGDLHIDTIPNGFYGAPDCGGWGRASEGSFIDDFFLIVNIRALPGTVLGQATTCGVRYDDETSVIGILTLNATQLNQMAGTSQLQNVVFHEIGHTLGFGIMWFSDKFKYIAETACVSEANLGTPEFLGPLAVKAWTDGGKTGNPPIENDPMYGLGTVCSHWKKSVFRSELMTGIIEPAGVTQQVSSVTIASMADLGFKVDMTKADPFVPPGAPMALQGPSPWGSEIRWPGPWEIVQNEPIRRLGGPGPRDRR